MQKKLFASFIFICLGAVLFAQTPPPADEVVKQACSKAAKEKKNVLLIFHASWCGWCRKMDKSLADSSCKKFFDDSYVITHLVSDESKDKKHLENPGVDSLKNKWGGKEQGLPYWVVLDASGKLLADSKMRYAGAAIMPGENVGCPATEKEVLYFLSVLRKTSNMTREQLEIIQKRFRKNEI